MDDFSETRAAIEMGIQEGWHRGAQLHAIHGGQVVVDIAVGEARPGIAMTPDSLLLWLSAGKPITAVAVLQLQEHGLVDLDAPVDGYLPGFAAGGKQSVTVRHLLTHTAGFRLVHIGWPKSDWDEIIRRIMAVKIEPRWVAGEQLGYHVYSSWYVLGELVRCLDGRELSEYLKDAIYRPLSMVDSWLGMGAEVFQAYGDRISLLENTSGVGRPDHAWDTQDGAAHPAPGGNMRGPIRELARFYQMLGGGTWDGSHVLSASSIREMTRRQIQGSVDQTFRHPIDWGLGVMINTHRENGNGPYGFGSFASRDTFGHGGNQSSMAFCDPANDLVVAWATNGMPGEKNHQQRNLAINEAIYRDLGLDR